MCIITIGHGLAESAAADAVFFTGFEFDFYIFIGQLSFVIGHLSLVTCQWSFESHLKLGTLRILETYGLQPIAYCEVFPTTNH